MKIFIELLINLIFVIAIFRTIASTGSQLMNVYFKRSYSVSVGLTFLIFAFFLYISKSTIVNLF